MKALVPKGDVGGGDGFCFVAASCGVLARSAREEERTVDEVHDME